MLFKKNIPDGFLNRKALPSSTQKQCWQEANRAWWEKNPMRYDWKKQIHIEEFTKEFYLEIDRRFFSNAKVFMPWTNIPFDNLIDYESLHDKNVLEIGVGNGSHALLLAKHSRSFTGIDITDYAVKSTTQRMSCFNIKANILRMDAEHMEFPDNSFDFVWSWGVIHHSANTRKIIEEIFRVLRPGGRAVTMVYHRSLWNYYIVNGLLHGILQGDLFRTKSLHKTVQKHVDGAMARFYTIAEWEQLLHDLFKVEKIYIFGSKEEIVSLPASRFKDILLTLVPDKLSRFFTNRLKMGGFLVSVFKKM